MSAEPPADPDGGIGHYLPLLGGIALGAGLIAFLFCGCDEGVSSGKRKSGKKSSSEDEECCVKIDPKKRKWPIDECDCPPKSSDGKKGSGSQDDGIKAWLPLVGGIALGAGFLALIYKLFFSRPKKTECPVIDPKKQRWPKEKAF